MLSAQTIVTLSNVATLLVLAATAIAAVVQLKHVRAGHELQAMLAIERRFASPQLQSALVYVARELPLRLNDRAYREELIERGYVDPARHPEMIACTWFDEVGTLIAGGFLPEAIVLDSFGRLVAYYWDVLSPAIALLRRRRGSDQYAQFELLAVRAARRRAGLGKQRGAARLPLDDPWLAADTRPANAGGVPSQ